MVITFEDEKQLEYISNFVNRVSGIYDHSSASTISTLAHKLHEAYSNKQLTVDLTEDPTDNHDNDQLYCLYNICGILNRVDADEVDAGIDMYNVLRKHYVKSDVPRFLEMLKGYKVPAEYCTELFGDWCSNEEFGNMAKKCMDIQANHNIVMTPVWEWILHEEPSPDIDWCVEMNKYRKAINEQ